MHLEIPEWTLETRLCEKACFRCVDGFFSSDTYSKQEESHPGSPGTNAVGSISVCFSMDPQTSRVRTWPRVLYCISWMHSTSVSRVCVCVCYGRIHPHKCADVHACALLCSHVEGRLGHQVSSSIALCLEKESRTDPESCCFTSASLPPSAGVIGTCGQAQPFSEMPGIQTRVLNLTQ